MLPLLLLLPVLLAVPARAATTVLEGVDTSSYQHGNGAAINWTALRDEGRRFVFLRATSNAKADANFAQDWRDAAAAGLFHGAYHYAKPGASSGKLQADFFADAIGDQSTPGTLPPVLDLEESGGLSVSSLRSWAQAFLTELEARTGRVPILYTNPNSWHVLMGDSTAFSRYPLWEAHYTSKAQPNPIAGWSSWTFWQYTSSGSSSGISGAVDQDRFNGSSLDLGVLANSGTWGPPSSTAAESDPTPTLACGGYTGITPQRVLDTRSGSGPVSGQITVTLPSSVPVDAAAVQLDVTAVEASGPGYLRVAAAGSQPTTTALTYGTHRSTTGLVTTKADGNRQVTVSVLGTAVDLVVDVTGYFGAGGALWHSTAPTRAADSRTGNRLPQGPLSGPVDLDLSSLVPATATGVYLDVSAVNPTGLGYVRLGAAGSTPTTTVLTYDRGGSTTGLAVSATGGQHVALTANGAPTDLVVDLLGWFDTAGSDGSYCTVAPQRFLDTRTGLGASGPGQGPLGLTLPSGVPSSAVAVVLDASAVAPHGPGFVRVTTVGQEATTTSLNLIRGRSVTGLIVVPVQQGQVVAGVYGADTDLVLDLVGYIGPSPAPTPSPSPSGSPSASPSASPSSS
ncbi:MAG: glycoside hydrolase family 25 [Frankiales bacterium]|nr:glycoside hydrolase family 25 [Frankiales bacterium]